MSLRWSARLAAAVAVAIVIAGCGSTGSAATPADVETRVFTADNGEVTIPAHPRRVVATGYAVPALIEAGPAYEAKAAELKAKYAGVVSRLRFGHVGLYGQITDGTFHREFNGSWGTNVAQDVGANYYGAVKNPGPGSRAVSEYPSMEEIADSLGEADAITYSVSPDGLVPEPVQQVLDSQLWTNLPAVQAGRVFPIRYTEAATYSVALKTLDSVDQAFAPLLIS
jgi:iron complex transport system substrate-binding protein